MIAILVAMKWHLVVFGLHFLTTNDVERVSFTFERDSVSRGGAEREGDTESETVSRLSQLSAQSSMRGSNTRTVRS